MTRYVLDIETNPVDFKKGNYIQEAHTVHCIVLLDADTGRTSSYYNTYDLRILGTAPLEYAIRELEKADELIGHNIIQFDIPILRKLFNLEPTGRIHDTLVTSRTLYPDRVGGHSLEAWGERLGYPKGDHSDFTEFSEAMLRYCEQDTKVTLSLYKHLQQEAKHGDWTKAIELEHKIAEIIAEQERRGFAFNKAQAEQYVIDWRERIHGLDSYIHDRVHRSVIAGTDISKPFKINGELNKRTLDTCTKFSIDPYHVVGPFSTFTYELIDLNSKEKQKKLLLDLGWKPRYKTKTGAPQICDSIKEVPEVGERISLRNTLSHRMNQVSGWIEICTDGRVHGGANPCGTNTARMRHQRIVNVPRVSSFLGQELRGLFTVPPNKVLVGYDAKALELRILAHYIGNEDYNERVTTTDKSRDAHILAARAAERDDRDLGKTINYALIYGAGDRKLGSIIGGTEAVGARLRAKLYESIPGLEQVVARVKQAARRGYLLGLDGRKLYLRERVSPLNTLIQGGGAIFMKTAAAQLANLVRIYNVQAIKVVDMHDEAQWECVEDEKEINMLNACIEQSFFEATEFLNLKCAQEAEVKIGKTWAETH